MCFSESWLREQTVIRQVTPPTLSAWSLTAPHDPMRFAVILPKIPGGAVGVFLGSTTPTLQFTQMDGNHPTLVLHRDTLGDLVCLPLWIFSAISTGVAPLITTLSYNPIRKLKYDEWHNKQLFSQSVSS